MEMSRYAGWQTHNSSTATPVLKFNPVVGDLMRELLRWSAAQQSIVRDLHVVNKPRDASEASSALESLKAIRHKL